MILAKYDIYLIEEIMASAKEILWKFCPYASMFKSLVIMHGG